MNLCSKRKGNIIFVTVRQLQDDQLREPALIPVQPEDYNIPDPPSPIRYKSARQMTIQIGSEHVFL